MGSNDFFRLSNTAPSAELVWANAHPLGRQFFPFDRGRVVFVVFWNFDIDSFEPKREHIQFIRNNRRFLEFVQRAAAERRFITFEGRSSRSGNNENENRRLSYQRALNIKKFIFDMPSYSGFNNPINLLRGFHARGSNNPINFSGLTEGGQEAYNRSVTIYWGDNNLNPLSREEIEDKGRSYIIERTGWSLINTFWDLWTPSHELFNHIVPAEIGSNRVVPSLEVLNRYKKPLSAYINEHNLRSENDVRSGIDRWLVDVRNARDNRLRQENNLRHIINNRMSGGGASALASDLARYNQFVQQYLDRYDSSCVFHNSYNLSRL